MNTIAKIQTNGWKVLAAEYNNKQLKSTHIIERELKSLNNNLSLNLKGNFDLKTFNKKDVKLVKKGLLFSREMADGKTAKKVQKSLERQFSYEIVNQPEYIATKSVKKTIIDKAKNVANKALLEKVLHAKISDIAMLTFFVLAMVLLVVHNPAILAFGGILLPISSIVFGSLNVALVGPIILVQALKNAKKAYDMNDKKEFAFAITGALFGVLIMTFGIVSITSVTNQLLFRSLMGIGALFSLTFASYNSYKTISLKRDLIKNQNNLREFFKKRVEINEVEQSKIRKRSFSLSENQLNKRLKKLLSKKAFEASQNTSIEKRRELLYLTELENLQKRKMDNIQSILREDLTKRSLAFINNKNASKEEENKLYNDIKKELRTRQIVEIVRASAPLIGLGSYGINMSSVISSPTLSNFVYNAMMFVSMGLSAPFNYVKAYRNVETKEESNKVAKVVSDYLIKPAAAA